MPEKKERQFSAVATALKNVAKIRTEIVRTIKQKQRELAGLQRDLVRVSFGAEKIKSATERRVQPTGSISKRLDWSEILAKVPSTFTAADVKTASGKDAPSEVFAAITRWMKAGTVVKKERGVYAKRTPMRAVVKARTQAEQEDKKTRRRKGAKATKVKGRRQQTAQMNGRDASAEV